MNALAIVFDQLMQDSKGAAAQNRLNEAIRQHPDLATDLRELFATAQIADDIALLQSSELNHLTGGGSKTLRTSGTLAALDLRSVPPSANMNCVLNLAAAEWALCIRRIRPNCSARWR
jgi:hypothetical protein